MRELSCYEYVPIPFARVRDALVSDANGIFQRATAGAAARARDLVATLHAQVGALEVGADVVIEVVGRKEGVLPGGEKTTELELRWRAARAPGLFPAMSATLSVYPLSSRETQLDLQGRYTPPFSVVGVALDAAVGHRIAQASVLRFVQDIAAQLAKELAEGQPAT
jgi:hypothetical protein